MAFAKLGTIFNQDRDGIGQCIISEHKSFQGYSLSLFNHKTRRHNIHYVLDQLKGNFVNKKQLLKRYDEFHDIYERKVKENLSPNMKLEKLVSNIKLSTVPRLTASISALWTLQKADHYFQAEDLKDQNNYLLQPHATQVISIFRMLGIGDTEERLINNLVQIGTGEEKSVTLGVTASILALLGFDVHCACYSEYLSQRDY
ncbi:unnamed protein product [Rotaria sp. Silwood2]|nr:unnamed protein product [Rotaria sp. Silwood2]